MFAWFDATRSEEFGASLAKFFVESLPADKQMKDAKFASKIEFVLKKMETRVQAFKQSEKLNIYKTAKLANAFKWTLKDSAVDENLSARLMEWLMAHL